MIASSDSLRAQIERLGPWFHNLRLGELQTAPDHFLFDYPAQKFAGFAHAIPADLSGLTVLDIGCNAGFYALEMKRRNAARVLGIDEDERYLRQARFAAQFLGVDIEFRNCSVYDVASLGEKFDLVLFMGVLYHLRHPLLALDLIHTHVAKDLLVFQSLQRGSPKIADIGTDYAFAETAVFHTPGYPVLHFIEHAYAHDPTNWWVPNAACVAALLRASGFAIVSRPEPEVFICQRGPAPFGAVAIYPAREPQV